MSDLTSSPKSILGRVRRLGTEPKRDFYRLRIFFRGRATDDIRRDAERWLGPADEELVFCGLGDSIAKATDFPVDQWQTLSEKIANTAEPIILIEVVANGGPTGPAFRVVIGLTQWWATERALEHSRDPQSWKLRIYDVQRERVERLCGDPI